MLIAKKQKALKIASYSPSITFILIEKLLFNIIKYNK